MSLTLEKARFSAIRVGRANSIEYRESLCGALIETLRRPGEIKHSTDMAHNSRPHKEQSCQLLAGRGEGAWEQLLQAKSSMNTLISDT